MCSSDLKLRVAVNDFDFNSYVRLLTDFANEDLSAFFFDIRKDCLYCDAPTDPKRMAYRTVLDILFHALVRYAAPVLVFTSEEVWQTRFPDADSVHFSDWPEVDAGWVDNGLGQKWETVRYLRTAITGQIEPLRREKTLGSSLEAEAIVTVGLIDDPHSIAHLDFAELAIVSHATISLSDDKPLGEGSMPWVNATIAVTTNHKCGRCWRHLPEVVEDGALCGRCEDVVGG